MEKKLLLFFFPLLLAMDENLQKSVHFLILEFKFSLSGEISPIF